MSFVKSLLRRLLRLDVAAKAPVTAPPRPAYAMSSSMDFMVAATGFVSNGRSRVGGLAEDEHRFIRDMIASSRRIGVNPMLAKSPIESERAEFYHAIPKILEARAFELGLMP